MNDHLKASNYDRPKLETPNGESSLLLHSCCAPCAGEIMEAVAASDIDTTVYFYNPNLHPIEEYQLRKEENKRYCESLDINKVPNTLDQIIWPEIEKDIVKKNKIKKIYQIKNIHRAVGTRISYELYKKFGDNKLEKDEI